MKDNFSLQAAAYAKHRPVYPPALFDHLFTFVPEKKLAWDCGTGNGQTAAALSNYFEKIYATDISIKQLENAAKAGNIIYAAEPAERTSLKDSSTDLITVSQALHWFDFDRFYAEARRVAKPAGIIAVWTYTLLQTDPVTDKIIQDFHFNTLEKYWDKERAYVDNGYATIPFPFKQLPSPEFSIQVNWTPEALMGYLNTWSALQKFIAANNYNPVEQVMRKIKQNWPAGENREIIFPIKLKIGQVH
jgi:ubiquinone/menaquinone biosynthesis C-methylase UbiE